MEKPMFEKWNLAETFRLVDNMRVLLIVCQELNEETLSF